MSYLCGGNLMMSPSPITFSKYCVQRNPSVWHVVMSHDVEHDRLLCDPRERAVRRAACNWVTVATGIDRLWRRRMHRHLLSLLGLRNGSYRLEGKGRHGLGRRLALVGKANCAQSIMQDNLLFPNRHTARTYVLEPTITDGGASRARLIGRLGQNESPHFF